MELNKVEKIITDFQIQERLFDRMYGNHVMNISFATRIIANLLTEAFNQ